MYQKKLAHQPSTYRPVIAIQRIAAHEKLYTRLFIAAIDTPTTACGTAKRIGITGTSDNDLVLYRIKLWTDQKRLNYMLPSLFVVTDGIFLDVNDWQAQNNNFSTLFQSLVEQKEHIETGTSQPPFQDPTEEGTEPT